MKRLILASLTISLLMFLSLTTFASQLQVQAQEGTEEATEEASPDVVELTQPAPEQTPVPTLAIPILGTLPPTPTPNALIIYDLLPQMGLLEGEVPQFTSVTTTADTQSLDETISRLREEYPDRGGLIDALGSLYRSAGVLGTHSRTMLAPDCEGFALFGFGSWLRLLPGEGSASELFGNPLVSDLYANVFGWVQDAGGNLPGNLYTVPAPADLCRIPSTIYNLDYPYGPVLVSLAIYAPNTTPRETIVGSFPAIVTRVNERIAERLGFQPNGALAAAAPDAVESETAETPVPSPTAAAALNTPAGAALGTSGEKGYPCPAAIVFNQNSLLNIVRAGPSGLATLRQPIRQGADIVILAKDQETRTTFWYQIANTDGQLLGWVPVDYVILSEECPE